MRGYKEEGTTTTPFDMAMLNGIDRFQLAIDASTGWTGWRERHSLLRQSLQDRPDGGTGPYPRARRGPGGDPELDTGLTVPSPAPTGGAVGNPWRPWKQSFPPDNTGSILGLCDPRNT